ncbi:spore wall protein 2 isoform X2 [Megalops cyprinoides]|uniref:spore wall protein 2 isoform X2 n=1 Tax=Megalops cyprinoides TaxID=118141 RepID=UPI0018651A41|nr:spore wall protein 2 isoform X2 [Megalops cyprinoides]
MAAAAASWAGPVEGDGCETAVEAEPTNLETVTGQAEEGQPAAEAQQASEQSADGKSKPASEKIWGSFLKNSGLGKVMGGRKKKEQAGGGDGGEGVEQEKSPTHGPATQGEGASPPSSPKEQSANEGGTESQEQGIEKEPEGEEGTQEQKPSSKDAKPKQGEKSSVRDFIRKPVARIFSHRSTEKKDFGTDAPKRGKTRSKSLDRLEDAEVCPAETDQTDESQVAGESQKSAAHSAKHMKRWHSFKKMMAQKSLKKSTEDTKDVESAEGPGSDTQIESEALESATKLEHSGQKRWKLKRSWTFQGLKRDPSVIGIHKPKGSDKDFSDNPKGEETPADVDQGAAATTEEPKAAGEGEAAEKTSTEEDKGQGAQRTKLVDHHANEIWTSFKKRVIPKSKKAGDAGGGGGGGEEEQAGEHEQMEEQAGREHGKSGKTRRTHFNRAVSLKNFIMRKGKSASVDMGEGGAGQKEEGGEGADVGGPTGEDVKESDGPADEGESEGPAAVQNGGDEAEAMGADGEEQQPDAATSSGQQPETACPDAPAAKEEAQAEPVTGPKCGEKTHGQNGSPGTGCDGKASAAGGKEEKTEDIIAQEPESAPQEDGPQEKAKQEDVNSQEAAHQAENACSGSSKDEKNLNQEQCSERKCCSGNPVAQSEKMAGKVKPHKEH